MSQASPLITARNPCLVLGMTFKERCGLTGKIKKRAMEMNRGLGNVAYEEALVEEGLFSLGFYHGTFVHSLRVLSNMGRALTSTKPGTAAPGSQRHCCRKHTTLGQQSLEGTSQDL